MGKTGHDMFCMRAEVFGAKQKPGKGLKKKKLIREHTQGYHKASQWG